MSFAILADFILHMGKNLTFGCEDFEDWFAFGEAFDTEVSEALDKCESKLERSQPHSDEHPRAPVASGSATYVRIFLIFLRTIFISPVSRIKKIQSVIWLAKN
jgi:hypothetical protein